jgi:hypothetical protein
MPYSVGEKGSYGCSGYPAVKDDGTVMGCHDTKEKAQAQITAINISEAEKSMPTLTDEELDQVDKKNPCWEGYVQRGMKEKDGRMVPNCVPVSRKEELGTNDSGVIVSKQDDLQEGDFVMGMTTEGIAHGVVEHIMWEGGTLGTPGSEYALESMPPENPAMSVRIYEEDEGSWAPTAYSIGMMYQDATKLESLEGHTMPEDMEDEMIEMSKADSYAPSAGMKAAARRALKWKADGKATGAGTPVGWGRASDIVAGRSMSLSVVKRMYSFFSRHEVDKKGKGFSSGPEFPSNGRIMWDAWGGDAGFSWSRAIVQREMDKVLFQGFGKDFTQTQRLTQIFPE